MLHPVGSQPPAVYWRRRLLVAASAVLLVVLLALTVNTLLSDGGGSPAAAGPNPTSSNSPTRHSSPPPSTAAQGSSAPVEQQDDTNSTAATTPAGSHAASTGAAPLPCTAQQLSVTAVVGKLRYAVGDQPVLTLQVTNTGPGACVQNVADSQILLRVYNGASRVWGSHDCQVQPGTDQRTLEVGKPAGFSIVWSGLTSQPGCAGTRQRVGAGTYTLYAALSGHDGKATQFVIS